MPEVWFYLLGGLTVLSSLALITARRMLTAVWAFGCVSVLLGGILLSLSSPFLAFVELWVGTSCFLAALFFARLLSGIEARGLGPRDPGRVVIKTLGLIASLVLAAVFIGVVAQTEPVPRIAAGDASVRPGWGPQLFTLYVAPLPVLGLLLLGTMIGAAFLLRRRSG